MSRAVRYSIFSFLVFSFVALHIAFVPLYCESIGFTPGEIAALSISGLVAVIIAGPFSVRVAHSYVPARTLAPIWALSAIISCVPLLCSTNRWVVIASWFFTNCFTNALSAIVDPSAMHDSTAGLIRFERVRLWGSLGFIVWVGSSGLLVDQSGISNVPWATWGALWLVATGALFVRPLLSAELLPDPAGDGGARSEPAHRGQFLVLVVTTALAWASHAGIYVYLSIYLQALGWSASEIALAWNVGVVAEILVFLEFRRFERHFSYARIVQISTWASVVRWTLLGSTTYWPVILFCQALHCLTFGAGYIATLKLIHEVLPMRQRTRAQSYIAAWGIGGGSLLGRLAVGFVGMSIGHYTELFRVFWLCGAIGIVGALLSLRLRGRVEHA